MKREAKVTEVGAAEKAALLCSWVKPEFVPNICFELTWADLMRGSAVYDNCRVLLLALEMVTRGTQWFQKNESMTMTCGVVGMAHPKSRKLCYLWAQCDADLLSDPAIESVARLWLDLGGDTASPAVSVQNAFGVLTDLMATDENIRWRQVFGSLLAFCPSGDGVIHTTE